MDITFNTETVKELSADDKAVQLVTEALAAQAYTEVTRETVDQYIALNFS